MQDIEIAPRTSRGFFLLVHILGFALGSIAAAVVGYFVSSQGQLGWRLLFAMGTLPTVTVLMVTPWLYETPQRCDVLLFDHTCLTTPQLLLLLRSMLHIAAEDEQALCSSDSRCSSSMTTRRLQKLACRLHHARHSAHSRLHVHLRVAQLH